MQFRTLFGLFFAVFILGQFINAARGTLRAGKFRIREKNALAMQIFRKGIGVIWFGAIFCYIFYPHLVEFGSYYLPDWLRWAGLILGCLALPLLWWTEITLDRNFNTTLHMRDDHTLVTTGPYRLVRHPMYTAIMLLGFALILTPANWLIAIPPVIGFAVILLNRLEHEEALMEEKFGQEYLEYKKRTGLFLPRIRYRGG